MGKCGKCGSYDVDVATDIRYTFECQDCGHKWNPRVKRTKKAGRECAGCGRKESEGYVLTDSKTFPLCDFCDEECRVMAADFVRYELGR